MNETSSRSQDLCPNCGNEQNDGDAVFCLGCGSRLGSSLIAPPPPLTAQPQAGRKAGPYMLHSLLWTAPSYSAYSASRIDDPKANLTIFEMGLLAEMQKYLSQDCPFPTDDDVTVAEVRSTVTVDENATTAPERVAFDYMGLLRPTECVSASDRLLVAFSKLHGLPIAQLDQMAEKEALQFGIRLCNIVDRLHRDGLVHNSIEPYSVMLGSGNRVTVIGLDRTRNIGQFVEDDPIYPSRGYTPPELFEPGAVYKPSGDVYSIGAVLQFLLTGERIESGEGSTIYPVAIIAPGFERLLNRALAENPAHRFQTAGEVALALRELALPTILRSGHFTDVGQVRELNEDSILALNLTQYYESVQTQIGLYIVSDGMGGEAAGEVASRVTVRAIAEWVTEKLISASLKSTNKQKIVAPTMTGGLRLSVADGNAMATTEMLKKAVISANDAVLAYASDNPSERGLGATVTAAMIVGDVLTIAHVGDSRCYLLCGDRLEQLTEDHSLVQRMVNTGNLSRSEARVHPYRNVIYRSIGGDQHLDIDIIRRTLSSQDVVLLCSDGLNTMLSDDQIRDILMVNPDPNAAAKELVVTANAAGGEDNTSVIVVRMS